MTQMEKTAGEGAAEERFQIMEAIMKFLKLFMSETLVKRVLSIVLICAGLDNTQITELTGYCNRSVRGLRKEMAGRDISRLLAVGGGRKRKTAGVENEILAELEKGNYHTRQQTADIIREKFHITISVSAVGKFLKKKRVQKAEKRVRLIPRMQQKYLELPQ